MYKAQETLTYFFNVVYRKMFYQHPQVDKSPNHQLNLAHRLASFANMDKFTQYLI